jgi:hypothetical protein
MVTVYKFTGGSFDVDDLGISLRWATAGFIEKHHLFALPGSAISVEAHVLDADGVTRREFYAQPPLGLSALERGLGVAPGAGEDTV